ncbi:MAG: hypothetical protein ABSD41_07300 [Candidatus Bathyarchaeia archaeon]
MAAQFPAARHFTAPLFSGVKLTSTVGFSHEVGLAKITGPADNRPQALV